MNTPTFTDLDIEFGRFPDLERIFGIKRGTAYALINEGKIRSRVVRRKGCAFGTRLIDFNSVREFLANSPTEPTAKLARKMKHCVHISVAKRAAAKNGAGMT